MGIGTATPDASAQLDISSTTQGFLPPRMTAEQRDAMTSVAASGLIIYCSNCGSNGEPEYYNGTRWVNMVGAAATPAYFLGQSILGGTIAYLLVNGDPGYDQYVQHGLVAATSIKIQSVVWYIEPNTLTGAAETIIGKGLENTNKIIASQGNTGSYAAKICRDYTVGGYTDWFLPSKDELNKLVINKSYIGGFTSGYYWSSSEAAYNFARIQKYNGTFAISSKSSSFYIMAIRAF